MDLRANRTAPTARRVRVAPAPGFTPYPADLPYGTLHGLFEQQVVRFPRRVAIEAEDAGLTYDELNRSANRLARAILARGGEVGAPVALLLGQGADGITASLAILKAGRIAVPLDPAFPRVRMAAVLRDAGSELVVTDARNRSTADEIGKDVAVLDIEDVPGALSDDNPGIEISSDSPAYIYYTSGSTGRPRGVIEAHATVLHALRSATNGLGIGPGDRVSQLFSLSYAMSYQSFLALHNGACTVPFDLRYNNARRLADWLQTARITIYISVPTVFRHLGRALRHDDCFPSLRAVYLTGEPLARADVQLFQSPHFPATCMLRNAYGATELGVACECYLDKTTELSGSVVPVGYPVDGVEVVLLDDGAQHVEEAPGTIGEIAFKSRYLSPGYWRDPAAMAAAFCADPRGGDERLFRTGDLGRFKADGCLEHLGRKDFQVKIRGYRVEVAEIEMALLEMPGIREAVVVTRENRRGSEQLVAFLAGDGPLPTSHDLRRFLGDRLPGYMVPARFVQLETLPLTPTGKVDRRALPDPDGPMRGVDGAGAVDFTPLEEKLAGIWSQLLGIERLGRHDDFFEQGGDSLLAIELVFRIGDELGINLPETAIYEASTVALLARLVADAERRQEPQSLVPIQPLGTRRPLFCVHAGYGGILYFTALARELDPEQPVYGLQARGLDGRQPPHTRIEDMAAAYIKELRTVQPHGPYCLLGVSAGGAVAYEVAQQLYAAGEEVRFLAIVDYYAPFAAWQAPHVLPPLHLARLLANFALHVPYWLDASKQLGAGEAWRRVCSRCVAATKALEGLRNRSTGGTLLSFAAFRERFAKGRLLEAVADWPAHRRQLVETHYLALRAYRPQPYPGRLTLFRCRLQPLLSSNEPDLGWGPLVRGGVEVKRLPDDHNALFRPPGITAMAAQLRTCLAAVQLTGDNVPRGVRS